MSQLKFKVGDRVKFIDYSKHGDWREHKDQVGTIYEIFSNTGYPYQIRWKDGTTSATNEDNLVLLVNSSNWNTHLINKGYLKKEGSMFTTEPNEVEEVEEEQQLKRYRVHCSETHYFYYDVMAVDSDHAEEIARSGEVDITSEDEYDNWAIDEVTER